jgi:hypothetical protein
MGKRRLRITDNTITIGTVLVPKQGKHVDPLVVLMPNRPDRAALVVDKAVYENAKADGKAGSYKRMGVRNAKYRDLNRQYWVDDKTARKPDPWDDQYS